MTLLIRSFVPLYLCPLIPLSPHTYISLIYHFLPSFGARALTVHWYYPSCILEKVTINMQPVPNIYMWTDPRHSTLTRGTRLCPALPGSARLCPALPGSCFNYIPLLLTDFWASNPNPNQYTQGTLLGVYLWETTSFSLSDLFDLLVPHVSLINSNCFIPQGGAPNPVSGYYTRGTLLGSNLHFQD